MDDKLELQPDELAHYGTKRHSGRYPWGSGENPYQGDGRDFVGYLDKLKSDAKEKGISESETTKYLADYLGISVSKLKNQYSYAKDLRRGDMVDDIRALKKEHPEYSNTEIGQIVGKKYNSDESPIGESTIRSLMNITREENMHKSQALADLLMDETDKKGMIDVGTGVGLELGVKDSKLNTALEVAQLNGYKVLGGRVAQQGHPGQFTIVKVLAKPGTPNKDIYNYDEIGHVTDYISSDNGETFRKAFEYPTSMDINRVKIRYAEEGGTGKDGLIEIRRGVKDLSLGNSDYAQVRILVDNDRYLKGMAAYSDGSDMPDGVDIIFNTNKHIGTDKRDVLKAIKTNPDGTPSDNPFGALIKERGGQSYYDDPDGKYVDPLTGKRQSLSLINKRSEENDWSEWSKDITSQMLAKQPQKTIDRQLQESVVKNKEQLDDILSVTNPTIKASLLNEYADNMDSTSVRLKASSFPGSRYHVILPVTSLKDNEVYAPNYPDGTQLALVRYPHAGLFEIPILTVNNHNKEAIDRIGKQAVDAVGINAKNAGILSGADFDGDTVQVIPTNNSNIKIANRRPLEGLADFDTKASYGPDDVVTKSDGTKEYYRNGVKYKHISEAYKQKQMGVVSNLITDMTLKGANEEELARAVKHSMVVIDAYKHHLDYKASEKENNIAELRELYQKHDKDSGYGGASTLLSRAKSPVDIPERKEGAYYAKDTGKELKVLDIDKKLYVDDSTGRVYKENEKTTKYVDPETGKKLYHETGQIYTKVIYKTSSGNEAVSPAFIKVDGRFKQPSTKYAFENSGDLYFKDYETHEFKKVRKEDKVLEPKLVMTKGVPLMSLTDDAYSLSSGTPQENAYAHYANELKALANRARKEALIADSSPIPYSKEAEKMYAEEVKSLNEKIKLAELNVPRERAANLLAASIADEKIKNASEELDNKDKQKIRQQELMKAREKFGARAYHFKITEKEWEAIQHGAINKSMLKNKIMRFADSDRLKELATPLNKKKISDNKIKEIKALANYTTNVNGHTVRAYTNADIARQLGVSVSEVGKILYGEED